MWLCDVCKSSYPTSESDKVDITVLKKEIKCLKRELSSTEKLLENLEYTVTIQKSLLENKKGNGLKPSLPTLKSDDVDPNHHSKPGTSKYSDALKKRVKNDSPVSIIKAPSELAHPKNIMDEVTMSINPGLITPQEILNDITSLNNFAKSQKNDIKFVTKWKGGNACHIVIEVFPTLRTALLNEGSIFIGWKKSPVFDHL
nr:unnamed protein product [Callosobruchus analis]